jgi:hypothetical protein
MRVFRAVFGGLCLAALGACGWNDVPTAVEATLCDLYTHPEKYAGKMVRVRAGSFGQELSLEDILHDSKTEPCPAYMRINVVLPDHVKPEPGFQLVRNEPYKKLEEGRAYSGPIHIDATYEGRFDAVFVWRDHKRISVGPSQAKGYGKKHRYDGRIVLREVSAVWAEPVPRK